MRRRDREIASLEEQFKILRACRVCRVAMIDAGRPYLVPVNFGAVVEAGKITIYLHGAGEGRKWEILRRGPMVCVEADCEHALLEAETACGYGYAYASVIGEGRAELLENPAEKIRGLSIIMEHQTGRQFSFTEEQVYSTAVFRITLEHCSGKRRKKPI